MIISRKSKTAVIGLLLIGAGTGCRSSMHLSLFGSKRSSSHLSQVDRSEWTVPNATAIPPFATDENVCIDANRSDATIGNSSTQSVILASAHLSESVFSKANAGDANGVVPDVVQVSKPDPIANAEPSQAIDLTTALMLTAGQNPQVAFARAKIEESQAQLDRAQALKLPSIRAGVNYNKHEGRIQDVEGGIIEASRGSFFSGFGANAVGAGSPTIPGIVSQFHFADAVFQPRIAQRTLCARRAGAEVATNDALFATAIAYIDLLRTQQELAIAAETLEQATKLAQVTEEFAKSGQGLVSDHDRARTELAMRKSELIRAEEQAKTASARLAELVRWDGTLRLEASESHLNPIQLWNRDCSSQALVAQALSNRPELVELRHLVGEAVERLNRERNAPLLPSVLLAGSYGGLGGGVGGSATNFGDRFDADAVAYWELRQLGVGESASRREAKARIQQARQKEFALLDRIAREVIESHTQVTSRAKQLEFAEEAIQAAEDSHSRNWERIRNGKGLPIEMLQSMQALANAQKEYTRIVADHNVAQFALCRALGWPAE